MMRSSRRHTLSWRRLLPVAAALTAGVSAALMLYRTDKAPPVESPVVVEACRVSVPDLVQSVETRRGVAFPHPLKLRPAPAELIAKRHLTQWQGTADLRKQAWTALGFRWEPDWPAAEAIAGLAYEEAGSYYDSSTGEFFYDERDAGAVRPGERARLTHALALALVQQLHGAAPLLQDGNDDAAQARASLARADAGTIATACLLTAPPPAADEPAPVPFYAAPRFLRELMAFPAQAGVLLSERLQGFQALDTAWQHPPDSAAAVLRPGTPQVLPCPAPVLPGRQGLYQGVLGDYGIQTLLRTQLTRAEVQEGSRGWAGDAYTLFEGGGLLWRSRWESGSGASAFSLAMSRTLALASGLPDGAVRHSGNDWSATAARSFHIRRLDREVWVITATDPAFLSTALQATALSSELATRTP